MPFFKTTDKTHKLFEISSETNRVLIVCILASFVAFLDGSVVNVALPAIMQNLHGGLVTQQWVVDAYTLTLGALMLAAGSLSDLFGPRKVLTIGLIGFGLTSLACALAPTSLVLIIARALQGVAGAFLVPSSLAIIIATFKGRAQGKAIGQWTAWTGIAFVLGPLLGGILVDTYSWRLIFAINVVPIAATLWLMRVMPELERRQKFPLDKVGLILGVLGLSGPVYALIEQSRLGWGNPAVLISLLGGSALTLVFLWHEYRTEHPLLPLSLFRNRNFAAGNAATLVIYAALALSSFVISIFVQQVGGYSAVQAGLAMLPITIIMFLLSGRFGSLSGKFGPRIFMTAGPLVCALGFAYMLHVHAPIHYWTQLLPGVLLQGLGLSITVAPLTSAVLGSIDDKKAGVASAVNNAVSRISGLVAIASVGLITSNLLTFDGFYSCMKVMVVLMVAGGFLSWVGIRNPKNIEDLSA